MDLTIAEMRPGDQLLIPNENLQVNDGEQMYVVGKPYLAFGLLPAVCVRTSSGHHRVLTVCTANMRFTVVRDG